MAPSKLDHVGSKDEPPMPRFKCLTITNEDKDRFDYALSDILCWLNGFTQGGGTYSPESQNTLRDLRDVIRRAYETIPPQK
jgi:hypothetical protein